MEEERLHIIWIGQRNGREKTISISEMKGNKIHDEENIWWLTRRKRQSRMSHIRWWWRWVHHTHWWRRRKASRWQRRRIHSTTLKRFSCESLLHIGGQGEPPHKSDPKKVSDNRALYRPIMGDIWVYIAIFVSEGFREEPPESHILHV